jgi:hypothetical protein
MIAIEMKIHTVGDHSRKTTLMGVVIYKMKILILADL